MDSEFVNAERGKEPAMEALGYEVDLDLDLAYHLQLQEALVASIALQPSSSSSPPPLQQLEVSSKLTTTPTTPSVETLVYDIFQQKAKDLELCQIEARRITEDLNRRIHDHKFAREIDGIPDEVWEEFGEQYEKPFGEGSSSSSVCGLVIEEPFKLYFKGLLSSPISAVGAAVCDPGDNLLKKVQKPLGGEWRNHREVELKALIEGLNAAISLDIKRINLYFTNRTIFQQVTGRWAVKQRRIATLVNQVFHLRKKFEIFQPYLVAGYDLKFAFRLARDAIDNQVIKSEGSSNTKDLKETCSICLEDADASEMFAIDGCLHRYCFSCMKQHMEVKILQGLIPVCPHEGCKTALLLDRCNKFLTPKLIATMRQLMKEASIPVTEKVYCPYPKCSMLMSKTEALEYANKFMAANRSPVRKCVNCHGLFCIDCKVPWHSTMSCDEFKRSNLSARVEETKLKSLAKQNLWRQCVKCNHMIELAEGCYHMTCRCGYEFCYTCGAEWKGKNPTCSCKLWDDWNIINDYHDDDDETDDDEYGEYDEYDDEDEHMLGAWLRRY